MLRENRQNDPLLTKLLEALQEPTEGDAYKAGTIKSYMWQAGSFLDYCAKRNVNPKTISPARIEGYLKMMGREVEAGTKSRSYFLQACSTLEILYRQALKQDRLARLVRMARKKILKSNR